ncbi:MAG: PhoD-like phosphatase N-terminal domain-containing protein, partial [Rhodocyclaceae bacterium]|nr:PhoD-like phosphatase N-terminal domain-containing protein [Rhodocyclaceae bacterium]
MTTPRLASRRRFIRSLAVGSAAVSSASLLTACGGGGDDRRLSFRHGVASGDPLADRVVVWTRVTPEADGEVRVRWQMAEDSDFTRIVAEGTTTTAADR